MCIIKRFSHLLMRFRMQRYMRLFCMLYSPNVFLARGSHISRLFIIGSLFAISATESRNHYNNHIFLILLSLIVHIIKKGDLWKGNSGSFTENSASKIPRNLLFCIIQNLWICYIYRTRLSKFGLSKTDDVFPIPTFI